MATDIIGRRRPAAVSGWFVLAILALVPTGAFAVDVPSLYTVEVPLQTALPDARANAYEAALRAVLVRITGSEEAANDEDLLSLFPTPARYVLQYRTGDEDTLIVTLDGPAIERLARQAGAPVWGSDRPLTLVWLAVDRGLGDREIVAAGDSPVVSPLGRDSDRNAELRDRVLAAAERRGVPVLFPLLDTEDLEAINFSDIWGGFDEALVDASRRYGATSILVGRIRSEDLFRNRWSYYFGNQQSSWSGTPETVVSLLADTLAERFAFAGNARINDVTLTISGIDSVAAYGTIQRLLADSGVIEGFRIDTVAGDEIRYRVRVQGGADRLATALEFSGVLRRPDWLGVDNYFDGSERESLEYVYEPFVIEFDEPGDDDVLGQAPASSAGPN